LDLVNHWTTVRERAETNDAIREGLADIDAGRHRSANEFMEEMRVKYNIPTDV